MRTLLSKYKAFLVALGFFFLCLFFYLLVFVQPSLRPARDEIDRDQKRELPQEGLNHAETGGDH